MVKLVTFPAVSEANADGLLAMGGDLSIDSLVSAYSQGIFPWFNEGQPVLWWSPDPRLVLYPDRIRIQRSLAKTIRSGRFHLSCDQHFDQVVSGCARRGQQHRFSAPPGTWITASMQSAYRDMHQAGYAHSVEVVEDGALVGGLYGVVLGSVFFGESMFSDSRDASKVALVGLCQNLVNKGFQIIDCQVESDHLFSMGAENIARSDFLAQLEHIDPQHPSPAFANDFQQPIA